MKGKSIWWIVGGLAALGAGYYLLRKFTKKGEQKAEDIKQQGAEAPTPAEPTQIVTGNPLLDISNSISNFLSKFQDYEVITQSTNLNVRSKPDSTSKVIGSLKKGAIVRAKASGASGWMAISDNDKDVKGYVSLTFLKIKK